MQKIKETPIKTFIINLNKRKDRRENIIQEFSGRDEFSIKIIEPLKDESPAISLWITIKYIIETQTNETDGFILICEDDHQFTSHYSKALFLNCLKDASRCNADILSGGVSCIKTSYQLTADLFWMEEFTGLQFTVIFRRFFNAILHQEFFRWNDADIVLSNIAANKLLTYPFISTQKEFGYSDVTENNNQKGHVEELFKKSGESIEILKGVGSFYKGLHSDSDEEISYESIYIPTYVINLKERTDRLAHIKAQFVDKNEFDVSIIEAVKNKKGNLGLWLTIRKIIELAIANEDDIIIICEDDHEFTANYAKLNFIKNILEAHRQGAGILLGGIGDFGSAVKVSEQRYWINNFFCTQFTVLYKKVFQDILDEPFNDMVTADGVFSEITSNKMVLFPFISTQKYLGHSNINSNNSEEGRLALLFNNTSQRLDKINNVISMLKDEILVDTAVNPESSRSFS